MSPVELKEVDEHYEVFVDGKFIVSGNTVDEVIREMDGYPLTEYL